MEETGDFQSRLEEALESKAAFLNDKHIPSLYDDFRMFQTLFENLYNILLRKSLIQEDPYKYAQKISEVSAPPRDPFLESERTEKMSRRLSQFHSQLDFLNNYYQFSLDFLTLDRLKRIISLVQYIDWQRLVVTSSNMTTGVLSEFFSRIRQGSDSVSSGIVNDSVNQLQKKVKQILQVLKELTYYKREEYKLELRRQVLSQLPETGEVASSDPEALFQRAKRDFRQGMGEKPFYPELLREVLSEEYGEERNELRQEVLKRLEVPQERKKREQKRPEHKGLLLDSIRLLSRAGGPLADSLRKADENRMLLETRRKSFGERFREWLQKVVQKSEQAQIVEIEYLDGVTATSQTERLNLNHFLEEAQRKARLLKTLANRISNAYQRVEAASEEQIFDFLDKNLKELQLIRRRLEGLDTYFKTEVSKDDRFRVKGIKIELGGIKNSIINANKKKHEYVAIKEEERQMKKLGIRTEAD